MRIYQWPALKGVREFFWPIFLLSVAFLLAVLSSLSEQDGQVYAAAFTAFLALLLAAVVSVMLIPRLLVGVKLGFLNHLQAFRVTRRGAFFILIVLVVAFSTINTGNNLLILVLSFLLASLLVSGLLSNLVLQGLKISMKVPEEIYAGQTAVFILSLHNLKKFFPSFALRLRSRGNDLFQSQTDFFLQEKSFPYMRPGELQSVTMHCQFSQRGVYAVDGFDVTTTFPFGFFRRKRRLETDGSIVVYPGLRELPLAFLSAHTHYGFEEKNRRGAGSTLYNIRSYRSGDNARFVHWKSTAKLDYLMVKDFSHEEEIASRVVFSTWLPTHDAQVLEKFERAVSWVAYLCHFYFARGHTFHFESGGFRVMVETRREGYDSVMHFLAQVRPGAESPLQVEKLKPPCILFSALDQPWASGVHHLHYLHM
ncbi:MAG: DUF58 domain-containing protein [Acidobacteria bacterium]|nr:DUF58 domain-containing protein [Acidobacteriota bacterium]